jgi:hypothetical protein
LLRTVALGMMARNSPEVLNLLLIDFKGGATFLDSASMPPPIGAAVKYWTLESVSSGLPGVSRRGNRQ